MVYDITLPLPAGWTGEEERYDEEFGGIITHLSCEKQEHEGKGTWLIDVYVGDMPSDTTAEDEAYANYAEIIGWDDDDDEENPIAEWKFQKRTAYGFSGECEDSSIMVLMCVEIKKGVLVILCVIAPDDDNAAKLASYVEEKLRVAPAK